MLAEFILTYMSGFLSAIALLFIVAACVANKKK